MSAWENIVNVLAISAHPDDETLGCGGTLLKHRALGDRVHWLIVTRAYSPQWSAALLRRKAGEVERVARAYGVSRYLHLDFPSTQLDTIPVSSMIAELRQVIAALRPRVVYLVHGGDVHSDHRAVFEATTAVLKSFRMAALGVRRLLSYETLSSTDAAPPSPDRAFAPLVFTDITPYLERKLKIMALYRTEAQRDPLPRAPSAIRALARVRGATVGVRYAEAFMLIREVD